MGFDGSAEEARVIADQRDAQRKQPQDAESQPTTTPDQVQTPPPNQEQTQIPTQAPEKKGPFGFLDFFARMKGQKPTPPPSGSEPYRTPNGEFGLKVNPDNVPDQADTDTVSNPNYDPTTTPDNIHPINESVASGGRLPTEPQEESIT